MKKNAEYVQFCLAIQYTWKAPAQRLRKVSAQDLDCLSCSPCRMSTRLLRNIPVFFLRLGIQIHG